MIRSAPYAPFVFLMRPWQSVPSNIPIALTILIVSRHLLPIPSDAVDNVYDLLRIHSHLIHATFDIRCLCITARLHRMDYLRSSQIDRREKSKARQVYQLGNRREINAYVRRKTSRQKSIILVRQRKDTQNPFFSNFVQNIMYQDNTHRHMNTRTHTKKRDAGGGNEALSSLFVVLII